MCFLWEGPFGESGGRGRRLLGGMVEPVGEEVPEESLIVSAMYWARRMATTAK